MVFSVTLTGCPERGCNNFPELSHIWRKISSKLWNYATLEIRPYGKSSPFLLPTYATVTHVIGCTRSTNSPRAVKKLNDQSDAGTPSVLLITNWRRGRPLDRRRWYKKAGPAGSDTVCFKCHKDRIICKVWNLIIWYKINHEFKIFDKKFFNWKWNWVPQWRYFL